MLDGATLSAVVIGGGAVATRKVRALAEAGAQVRVVAPSFGPEMESLSAAHPSVQLTRDTYLSSHIGAALLVIAATDDAATNSRIAHEARERGRLVNVVTAPNEGNCVTPAVHQCGEIVVAVTAGGVPGAAARIRDALAKTLDARYADAVRNLSALRRTMLDRGKREQWSAAADALLGDDFCTFVESGLFAERVAEWR
jgi:precorrin-2 dehydrogenase / sirohydrochlorin ferrochelatase